MPGRKISGNYDNIGHHKSEWPGYKCGLSGKDPPKWTWQVSWEGRVCSARARCLRRCLIGEKAGPQNDKSKHQSSEKSGEKSVCRIRVGGGQPAREKLYNCWIAVGYNCLHGAGWGTVYKLGGGEMDTMAMKNTIFWVWLSSFFTGKDLSSVWISTKGRESPKLSKNPSPKLGASLFPKSVGQVGPRSSVQSKSQMWQRSALGWLGMNSALSTHPGETVVSPM